MKKWIVFVLAAVMVFACAGAASAATMDDLDCTGWWTAHTPGVEITEGGVEITFTNTTYDSAENNWNGPLWVLYTGSTTVNGEGYAEYWVQRGDNWGWTGNALDNDTETSINTSDPDGLAAMGVTYACSWETEDYLGTLKTGCDGKITASRSGDTVTVTMSIADVTTTVSVPVATGEAAYLSLTGELTTLTNITYETQTTEEPETDPTEQTEEPTTEATEAPTTEATETPTTEATEAASTTVTLDDVDCTGWWAAHSSGIEITTEGVKITFTNTTYESAENLWNGPLWVLFSADEPVVNGSGYYEYWVQRGDNYGWTGEWANFINTAENLDEIEALGISYSTTWGNDDYLATLKSGCTVTITAIREGDNVTITMSLAGESSTVTIPVTSDTVYLAVSGELTTLTNISYTSMADTSPKDGDEMNLILPVILMASAAAMIVVVKKYAVR
ncbi:MAG: hypothetical protein LUJ09_00620 [Firmicutes bacterium]|nr:hypothetical protein [Bacillota bacterium]